MCARVVIWLLFLFVGFDVTGLPRSLIRALGAPPYFDWEFFTDLEAVRIAVRYYILYASGWST